MIEPLERTSDVGLERLRAIRRRVLTGMYAFTVLVVLSLFIQAYTLSGETTPWLWGLPVYSMLFSAYGVYVLRRGDVAMGARVFVFGSLGMQALNLIVFTSPEKAAPGGVIGLVAAGALLLPWRAAVLAAVFGVVTLFGGYAARVHGYSGYIDVGLSGWSLFGMHLFLIIAIGTLLVTLVRGWRLVVAEATEAAAQNVAANAALAASTVSMRTLEHTLATLPEGLAVTAEDGRISMVNDALLRALGAETGTLLGRPAWDVFAGASSEEFGMFRARMIASNTGPHTVDMGSSHANMETAQVSVSPLSEDGTRGGAVYVLHTESDEDRAQRLRGEFLSVVSHELRTPLTSVRGAVRLVASGVFGEMDAQTTKMLDVADRNAERLVHLIEDLMDMEAIQTGALQIDVTQASVAGLVERVLDALTPLAQPHGVQLDGDALASGVFDVDARRIEQVLTNLVSNAVKFSPPGGRVTLSARGDAHSVELRVVDEGSGVPAAFVPHLFEQFRQAAAGQQHPGSSGLGLTISQAIAEQHGGSLHYEDAPGGGACFVLRLPRTRGAKGVGSAQG